MNDLMNFVQAVTNDYEHAYDRARLKSATEADRKHLEYMAFAMIYLEEYAWELKKADSAKSEMIIEELERI